MLTHLVEIGDCEIQCLPRAEFKIIQETRQLEFDITNARQEKADWEQRNKSELKKLERKQAQLSEWIESNKQASQPAVAVVSQQLKEVSDHLAPLQKELATISKEISALASKFKSNTEKLKGFKKARKSQEDSVCTKIDKILKKYDINRAAYHGGDLQGNDVIKLMENAEEIMADVQDLFIRERECERCKFSEQEIRIICSDFALTLTVWDAIFAMSQRSNLTPDDCVQLQKLIDLGMKNIRKTQDGLVDNCKVSRDREASCGDHQEYMWRD